MSGGGFPDRREPDPGNLIDPILAVSRSVCEHYSPAIIASPRARARLRAILTARPYASFDDRSF